MADARADLRSRGVRPGVATAGGTLFLVTPCWCADSWPAVSSPPTGAGRLSVAPVSGVPRPARSKARLHARNDLATWETR